MERLWAPWRLDYVSDPDKEASCFLCEAGRARGDDRARLVLWRGASCFCILNRWPYNNGHLMVAPYEHKADLAELSEEELLDQMRMLRRCQRALKDKMNPAGFNIGLNLGKPAGAGVAGHIHWHIVPRWEGDTNFMPVLSDTKVLPQSLESVWEVLHEVEFDE